MAGPLAAIGGGGGSQKVKFGDAGPAESGNQGFNAGSTINFTPPMSLQHQENVDLVKWGMVATAAGVVVLWFLNK